MKVAQPTCSRDLGRRITVALTCRHHVERRLELGGLKQDRAWRWSETWTLSENVVILIYIPFIPNSWGC